MFGIVHSIYALESRSFVSARFQGQTPKHGAIPIPRSNACCPMFTSLSTVYLSKFFKIHWFLNKKDVCPTSYIYLDSTYIYLDLLIFTYIYHIFSSILNIFTHISTYFHVYFYLFLHIYHIFLLISTYLLLFSCIFLLISTYLLLFSTCRALHLLLPAMGTTCLGPIPTIVCYFTTNKSIYGRVGKKTT